MRWSSQPEDEHFSVSLLQSTLRDAVRARVRTNPPFDKNAGALGVLSLHVASHPLAESPQKYQCPRPSPKGQGRDRRERAENVHLLLLQLKRANQFLQPRRFNFDQGGVVEGVSKH